MTSLQAQKKAQRRIRRRRDSDRRARRRGVVLLVVLSLLVLFVVIGMMYALIASQYRHSAEIAARSADREDDLFDETDRALYMLLRDTLTRNPLQGHSLLNDLYGHHSVLGTVVGTQVEMNGQFLRIQCLQNSTPPTPPNVVNTVRYLRREDAVYSGCVLTFTTGRAALRSTRVFNNWWQMAPNGVAGGSWGADGVDDPTVWNSVSGMWEGDGNSGDKGERGWPGGNDVMNFRVEMVDSDGVDIRGADGRWGVANVDDDGNGTTDDAVEAGWPGSDDRVPTVGDSFVVNGRPFSGFGAGYSPITRNIDLSDNAATSVLQLWASGAGGPPALVSLMPNLGAYPTNGYGVNGGIDEASLGGMNEDWDAPDFQNFFLSYVPGVAPRADLIIPSFHRPELLRYWFNWLQVNYFAPRGFDNSNPTDVAQEQEVFLRPYGPNNILESSALTAGGDDPPNTIGRGMTGPDMQTIVSLKRRIMMRPLPEDHPTFTGSNLHPGPHPSALGRPNFYPFGYGTTPVDTDNDGNTDYVLGSWDVDNDGNGVPDSIWIDPLFPVKKTTDGRRFKTLIAVMIQDLDGRLSLNAHDSWATTPQGADGRWGVAFVDDNGDGNIDDPGEANAPGSDDNSFSQPVDGHFARAPIAVGTSSLTLPRGSGYGPAEISLAPLFNLAQRTTVIGNRYGPDLLPGFASAAAGDDTLSYLKNIGLPINYRNLTRPSAFGTPPDVFGRGALGLDYTGQPMYYFNGQNGETQNDPYELNLFRGDERANGIDSPYTFSELETVMRQNDADSLMLPSRLRSISAFGSPSVRASVTTDSRHIAMPPGAVARERRDGTGAGHEEDDQLATLIGQFGHPDFSFPTLLDAYRARLLAGGVAPNDVEREMVKIIPFEIFRGEPLDVNRLIGNGRDETPGGQFGSGTVDEPIETLLSEKAFPAPFAADRTTGVPAQYLGPDFSYRNDDDPSGFISGNLNPRVILARHLYCLMMLMVEQGYPFPHDTGDTDVDMPTGLPGSVDEPQLLTSIRIAQWAINAVEFRDADAIMSLFEFDLNPWNGWQVDGNPNTIETTRDRWMVIGAEFPDLMLTETLAFHDRRVKDTNLDSTGKRRNPDDPNDDDTLDQYRIPQGSLFVELFCPRNHANTGVYPNNNPVLPYELYTTTGQLDLARLSPQRPDHGNFQYPVWQIALSEHHGSRGGGAPQQNSPHSRLNGGFYESTSFELPNMGIPGSVHTGVSPIRIANAPLQTRRLVWFAGVNPGSLPGGHPLRGRTFYNRNAAAAQLLPGSYAVAGPRANTALGSREVDGMDTTYDGPSNQRILLGPGVQVFDLNNNLVTPPIGTGIRQPIGIVCDVQRPNWNNMNTETQYIGMNISEPYPAHVNYYPEPNPNGNMWVPMDAYDDVTAPVQLAPEQIPNTPLDSRNGMPLDTWNMLDTETYGNVRTAFLQRLADPTLPWNPLPTDAQFSGLFNGNLPINPYVTIDWMPIDLSVFTGEEDTNRRVGSAGNQEEIDPDDDQIGNRILNFGSRQRGNRLSAGNVPRTTYSVWSPNTALEDETTTIARPDPPAAPDTAAGEYMRFVRTDAHLIDGNRPRYIINSLGYLNSREFGSTRDDGRLHSLTPAPAQYVGSPEIPFPWLAWYNRPFNNPFELLLVPTSSPARLMVEFSTQVNPPSGYYDPNSQNINNFRGAYRHLFNFFHTTLNNEKGANLYRIFDYLETPSPFVGAETWFNPAEAAVSAAGAKLRPPYNRWSRFRDPGRVNLNTLPITGWNVGGGAGRDGVDDDGDGQTDEADEVGFPGSDDTPTSLVWNGLMENYGPFNNQTKFGQFFLSRQGYSFGYNDNAAPPYPSRFANPFRSAFTADMMPDIADMRKTDVAATLLRTVPGSTTQPLFATQFGERYRQTALHAPFAYQGMERLPNLTTNRSNVFAVWITVGYFEVIQHFDHPPSGGATVPTIDEGHLDGYQLGAEMGADTGDIKRHRAFYIIDRSVPMGFIPGENLNVDRAIRLRRVIE